MKLYLYCVLENEVPTTVVGINQAPLKLISFSPLSVVTSEFEGDVVPITRDNVLKHSSVINSVLERTTPLPFRFGTVVDESRLRSFMDARSETIRGRLALLQGYLEMSVKIIWGLTTETEGLEQVKEVGRGTAFLQEKKRELEVVAGRKQDAEVLADELKNRLEAVTKESDVHLRPNEKLVLAASHLIDRQSVMAYREKLVEFGRERPDLRFLVSGPWAPYSFANIELEFKSHFGVS